MKEHHLYGFLFVFIIAAVLFMLFSHDYRVSAVSIQDLYGFAWSEHIGWISFNSKNCDANNDGFSDGSPAGCPPLGTAIAPYNISIDMTSGDFSGFAWSEHIGWIKFDTTTTPPGEVAAKPVHLDTDGIACGNMNDICGWARVCSAVANKTTCEDVADPTAGGWSGWIKFRGTWTDAVRFNTWTDELEGWAWSDMVAGWISFSSKNCDIDGDGLSDGSPAGCPSAGTTIPPYRVSTVPLSATPIPPPPGIKEIAPD